MQSNYYFKCFDKYKNDIKILGKQFPDSLAKQSQILIQIYSWKMAGRYMIKKIANKFNSYFTEIRPNLAEQISNTSNKEFTYFLKNKLRSKFCFEEINENQQ